MSTSTRPATTTDAAASATADTAAAAARHRATGTTARVAVESATGRPWVRVTGRVHRDTVTELSGTVRGLLRAGSREVTVDLAGAHDAARLLPALARGRAALAAVGGRLEVVGIRASEFLPALSAAPLEEVFLVYEAVTARRRVPAA